MGRLVIIEAEEPKQTITEMIEAKKPIVDIVYNLENLNMQQKHDAEFMQQLEDVIMRCKKEKPIRPE